MLDKIRGAINVLKYGEELTHAELWKSRQNLVNALIALLGAATVFLPVQMSPEDIAAIAGGIAAVSGLFNSYLTTATTSRIGMQTGTGDNPNP